MKIDERGNPGFSHFRSHKIVTIKNCLLAAEPINTCLSELLTHVEFKHLGSLSDELELSLNQLSKVESLIDILLDQACVLTAAMLFEGHPGFECPKAP